MHLLIQQIMIISDKVKGYFFIILGILANSNVYIFSKAALNEIHIAQFGFYWFGFGLIWNILYAIRTCKLSTFRYLPVRSMLLLLSVALLELLGVTAFFTSIQTIDNPAVVSFIGNIGPFFVALLGIFILKESFTRMEIGGMVLTLIGAFVISYKGDTDLGELFIEGAEFAMLAALFFAISTIVSKKQITRLPPPLQSLARTMIIFLFAFAMLNAFGQDYTISSNALLNIAIGSVLGPFLTIFSKYNAMRFAEAARISILGATKPLVVLIFAYIYFGSFPLLYQIYGGLITVIGVFLITIGKRKLFQRKKVKSISS
ncbi:MAG: DMT family transporter [Bacteroidales bacterium]|nr:DMT family transporter [Bacteroidales bacterium]